MALLQEEFEWQGNWLFKRRGTLSHIIIAIGLAEYLFNKYRSSAILLQDDGRENLGIFFMVRYCYVHC